jgi:hypothetical protein
MSALHVVLIDKSFVFSFVNSAVYLVKLACHPGRISKGQQILPGLVLLIDT